MELQRGLVPPQLTPLSRQDTSLHGPALSHTFLYEALELVLIQELPSSGRSHPAAVFRSNRRSACRATARTVGARTSTQKHQRQMGSPGWERKPWAFHFLAESLGALQEEEMGEKCKLKRR